MNRIHETNPIIRNNITDVQKPNFLLLQTKKMLRVGGGGSDRVNISNTDSIISLFVICKKQWGQADITDVLQW